MNKSNINELSAGTEADNNSTAQNQQVSQPNANKNVSGWVSVNDSLPEHLETVWISNGKGWTTLGCRSDLYDNNGDGCYSWCWAAATYGSVYEEDGKIVAECEEDDLDVRFWHPLPVPPIR